MINLDRQKKITRIIEETRPAIEGRPPIAEWYTQDEFEEQRFDLCKCAIFYKSREDKRVKRMLWINN